MNQSRFLRGNPAEIADVNIDDVIFSVLSIFVFLAKSVPSQNEDFNFPNFPKKR